MELILWQLGGTALACIALIIQAARRPKFPPFPMIANLKPPTVAELQRPEWIIDDRSIGGSA